MNKTKNFIYSVIICIVVYITLVSLFGCSQSDIDKILGNTNTPSNPNEIMTVNSSGQIVPSISSDIKANDYAKSHNIGDMNDCVKCHEKYK